MGQRKGKTKDNLQVSGLNNRPDGVPFVELGKTGEKWICNISFLWLL